MRTRIFDYLRTQHLGLIALILVVAGGTAYAAGLAKNSVKSKQIKNGQVKSVDVRDQGLTGADLADGSIGSAEISDGGVGSSEISDAAVTASELANDAVTGQKIATGVIGGGKLSPGAVGTNKIEDGAVTGAKVADATISQSDLDPASVGEVISAAGTFAADGSARDVLAVPGFGALRVSCTDPEGMGVTYLPEAGAHRWVVEGRDSVDNAPTFSVDANNSGGGGFSLPNSITHLEGLLGAYTDAQVLRADYSIVREPGPSCSYQVRATVDANGA